jgi:formyltetrahydrofolate synthetase
MTFTQDKRQEQTVELPLSEMPITFDEKGEVQVLADFNLTENGFADDLVTEENLLRRVATLDLYPEAIEAVHWVLRVQMEDVRKVYEEETEEHTDITPQLATYFFGVDETIKHLTLVGKQHNLNKENVFKFANCIKTLADGFSEELVLCQKILNKLEDFMWASNNCYAKGQDGQPVNVEFVRTIAIGSLTQNLVGVGASLLNRVNVVCAPADQN